MATPYIGEIRMFGGSFAPNGWFLCNGQLVSIADYSALYTLIGTTYGGDGQNTFAVPDLQSRVPVHQGSGYPLAATGGAETVQLLPQNMPVHSHSAAGANSGAGQTDPTGNFWRDFGRRAYSPNPPNATMSASALAPAGGSVPHENLPPFVVVTFIISWSGIFPTQN